MTSNPDDSTLVDVYHRKRFLIVDDFENIRVALKTMVHNFGVDKIDTAGSGRNALNACKKVDYDVILCDYNLGLGKNGQQVLEELRFQKLLKHTSIFIIISAESSKDMVMAAVESQPDGYIAKPYTQASIKNRLDKVIKQKEVLAPINQALDKEDYARAIALCGHEIEKKSRYRSWCIQIMANLHYQEGDYDAAKKLYSSVLAEKDIVWANLGLAKVELAKNNFEASETICKNMLVSNSENIAAYELLSEIYTCRGELKKAQQNLEVAVAISPLNILRQKKLGEVCLENQDVERATDAYRKTVHLGEYSCYGSLDDHLEFSRCLTDLCDGDTSLHGKALFDEAITELQTIKKRYADSEDAQIQSLLIETRALSGQDHKKEALSALEQAKKMCESKADALSVDCSLELAKSLHSVDQEEEAREILDKLAKDPRADKRVQNSITEMLEESSNYKKKVRARNLNKKGIRMAEKGDLLGAIASFKSALVETPKHPGLNLNLVQTLLEQFQTVPPSAEDIDICRSCIERLKGIRQDHPQYERYVTMTKKVEELDVGLHIATFKKDTVDNSISRI